MKQLGELLRLEKEFAARGVLVVAVAKEIRKEGELAKAHANLPDAWFSIAGEIGGKGLERYAPTSGYFIDAQGVIRHVMPMETYNRPSWDTVFEEFDPRWGEE